MREGVSMVNEGRYGKDEDITREGGPYLVLIPSPALSLGFLLLSLWSYLLLTS